MPAADPSVAPPSPAARAALRRRLLAWFDASHRPMPWRGSKDPWAILVSEVMLQQTTVAAVVPYFERFVARWPTPGALARASREEILAAWAGLGYYRRADLLARTARWVDEHGGRFPRTRDELAALPGIGEYTAGALASIAFGEVVPAVDGNVERVLARLFALDGDPRKAPARRAIAARAGALVDPARPGDFNQALMELGARVCRPRAPECGACPIAPSCEARRRGEPTRWPQRATRLPPVDVLRVALVVARGGRVLLTRRDAPPNEGFLELPAIDAEGTPDPAPLVEVLRRHAGLRLRVVRALPPHRHGITRSRITVHPFAAVHAGGRVRDPFAWVDPCDLGQAITTASRRIVAQTFPDHP